MANLKDIRRRIISVKSTQKITRAMKLVSAAKFARASVASKGAAPFGEGLEKLVKSLSSLNSEGAQSELTERREEKNIAVVVITTDRGLCGGLNANVLKRLAAFSAQKKKSNITCDLVLLGRRAASYHKINSGVGKVIFAREKVNDNPNNQFAKELALLMVEKFKNKEIDGCYIIYPKFVSALSQVPKVDQLLPVAAETVKTDKSEKAMDSKPADKGAMQSTVSADFNNYIIEPSVNQLLDKLFERQLTNKIFRAVLDARASEQGARMTAMDSATNNATTVIHKLTLEYNRGRQAAITKELIEITSGAQAL